MKKVYFLKTCNTCIKIIKSLNLPPDFVLQDIKEKTITVNQLEELHRLSGSYKALFSKRAKLYKEMGLKDLNLTEEDYKHYILEHYTFLNRPVIVVDNHIFVGNSAKVVEAAEKAIKDSVAQ
ncbi:MAG TPA: ArsC/Spx/MgsR family protein [Aquaticitalea sp.]|nr:ArsC/Spx/MgsR family protein [Aquaticitalea sp.]HNU60399.1 ArsC/Spx/MgsR family protein [Aquaticitalea sp.]